MKNQLKQMSVDNQFFTTHSLDCLLLLLPLNYYYLSSLSSVHLIFSFWFRSFIRFCFVLTLLIFVVFFLQTKQVLCSSFFLVYSNEFLLLSFTTTITKYSSFCFCFFGCLHCCHCCSLFVYSFVSFSSSVTFLRLYRQSIIIDNNQVVVNRIIFHAAHSNRNSNREESSSSILFKCFFFTSSCICLFVSLIVFGIKFCFFDCFLFL